MTESSNERTPQTIFGDQIRKLFSATCLTADALPALTAKAPTPVIHEFLVTQERQSLRQKERLAKTAALLGIDPASDESQAMKGLIEGGDRHVRAAEGTSAMALILVAHFNRIILHQLTGYEFAQHLARSLDLPDIENLLSASLNEICDAAGTLADFATDLFH